MKIKIVSVSNKLPSWLEQGCSHYIKNSLPYASIDITQIKPTINKNIEVIKKTEANNISKKLEVNSCNIALDLHGRLYSSEQFAKFLSNKSRICFVVGGAFGLHTELKDHMECISISKMTLPHNLAKLVLLEQIFRALTINADHPYHK